MLNSIELPLQQRQEQTVSKDYLLELWKRSCKLEDMVLTHQFKHHKSSKSK